MPIPQKTYWKSERAKVLIDTILENDEFDILCFQELFWRPSREIFIERLKDRYPYYFVDDSLGKYFFGLNSGLATFSKYRIVDTIHHTYKDYRGVEDLAKKGVIGVKLNLSTEEKPYYINVFTTHIQSGIGDEPYIFTIFDNFTGSKGSTMSSYELKKSQLSELVETVQKFSGVEENIIIAGDLNIDSRTKIYRELKQTLKYREILDLFDSELDFDSELILFNASTLKGDKRIDYVWSNMNGKSVITSKYGNSRTTDHRDVIAKFTLEDFGTN